MGGWVKSGMHSSDCGYAKSYSCFSLRVSHSQSISLKVVVLVVLVVVVAVSVVNL